MWPQVADHSTSEISPRSWFSAGREGPPAGSLPKSPRRLNPAHVTLVGSACGSLGPSARHVDTARPPPSARSPRGSAATSGGRDAAEPAALVRRDRGRPRPAERGRSHLLAAAVQDPGSRRAALGGFRAELEREIPDRVPGKEPHRPRRRGGLGRLSSWSSGSPSRGGAGRGRGITGWAWFWSVGVVGGRSRSRRVTGRPTFGATARAQPVTRSAPLSGPLNSQPLCVLMSNMWMVVESTSQRYIRMRP